MLVTPHARTQKFTYTNIKSFTSGNNTTHKNIILSSFIRRQMRNVLVKIIEKFRVFYRLQKKIKFYFYDSLCKLKKRLKILHYYILCVCEYV